MRKSATISCGLGFIVLSAVPTLANDSVFEAVKNPKNWAMQQGDYSAHRYSKLDQINTKNVGSLRTAWSFSTGVLRGHEGSPLVIGNLMYVHAPFPNTVYALDLDQNQKIAWKYSPKQDPSVIPVMCCDTVNRGVQYADGKIFLYQADATLVALDAKSGKVLYEINGVAEELAREAFTLAAAKLPLKCTFVARQVGA